MHARWLEEGCICVSKTTLERGYTNLTAGNAGWHETTSVGEEVDREDGGDDGGDGEGGEEEHPNARLRWTWSELQS